MKRAALLLLPIMQLGCAGSIFSHKPYHLQPGMVVESSSKRVVTRWANGRVQYGGYDVYIYASLIKCCLIFGAYLSTHGVLYAVGYYTGALIHAGLIAVVAVEMYNKTFGPRVGVPAWIPRRTSALLVLVALVSVIIGLAFKASNGGPITQILVTCEKIALMLSFGSLVVIATYSKWQRISWSKNTCYILLGFIGFLAINVVTVFLRGNGTSVQSEIARRIGPISYIIALMWWSYGLPRGEQEERTRVVMAYHHARR